MIVTLVIMCSVFGHDGMARVCGVYVNSPTSNKPFYIAYMASYTSNLLTQKMTS